MKYRPEIDGLRAIAVLPVIFFHAGFEYFDGGFTGVDIFFVVSGYLITTIIYKEIKSYKFSLWDFYERRARRIIPALSVVCMITAAGSWVLMSPAELSRLGDGLVGVGTFTSNVTFWLSQGYFEESSELNPILHTWSLGVEEQFYLVFPLLMLLLASSSQFRVTSLLLVLVTLSLMLSIWAVNYQTGNKILSGAFFLLPTRAWELGAGSIVAIALFHRSFDGTKPIIRESISFLGLTMIFCSFVFIKPSSPFPGYVSIYPVLGTSLLIAFTTRDTIVGKVLSSKLLAGIGAISYSLYLVHQPVFSLYRIGVGSVEIANSEKLILIAVVFLFSCGVWKYVEQPFRNRKYLKQRTIFYLTLVSCVLFVSVGYISSEISKGFEFDLAKKLSKAEYVYFQNVDERKFNEGRLTFPLTSIDSLVIGSSRLMQFSSDVSDLKSLNLSVSGATLEDFISYIPEATIKIRPKSVIFGIDPWLFNEINERSRWKSSFELYTHNLNAISKDRIKNEDDIQFLANRRKASDESNIFSEIYKNVNISKLSTNNRTPEAYAKKAYDGTHIYNKHYSERKKTLLYKDLSVAVDFGMRDYKLSDSKINKFLDLVEWLRERGVLVSIILSPYHPAAYDFIVNERPVIREIESLIRELGHNHGIAVMGSYDPYAVGCTAEHFYDASHPTSECLKKVVAKYRQ